MQNHWILAQDRAASQEMRNARLRTSILIRSFVILSLGAPEITNNKYQIVSNIKWKILLFFKRASSSR